MQFVDVHKCQSGLMQDFVDVHKYQSGFMKSRLFPCIYDILVIIICSFV